MAHKYQQGEQVQLKSGGPPMTIDKLPRSSGDDEYFCVWFKGAARAGGYFGEHLLDYYTPPGKK